MDRYIDSYWMVNCPNSYSMWEIYAAVRILINNIMKFSNQHYQLELKILKEKEMKNAEIANGLENF